MRCESERLESETHLFDFILSTISKRCLTRVATVNPYVCTRNSSLHSSIILEKNIILKSKSIADTTRIENLTLDNLKINLN